MLLQLHENKNELKKSISVKGKLIFACEFYYYSVYETAILWDIHFFFWKTGIRWIKKRMAKMMLKCIQNRFPLNKFNSFFFVSDWIRILNKYFDTNPLQLLKFWIRITIDCYSQPINIHKKNKCTNETNLARITLKHHR